MSCNRWWVAVTVLLVGGGCTNDTPIGSWVEIIEADLSDDALLVEDESSFVSVTVEADRLTFTFDGASPLRVGHVVAGDPDGAGPYYLRRITALEEVGGLVIATTEPAGASDFYDELHFIFHYRPVQVDGSRYIAGVGDVAGRVEALEGCEDRSPCTITGGREWFGGDAGCTLTGTATMSVEPYVTTDFTADFEFSLRGRTVVLDLGGSAEVGIRATAGGAAELTCTADFAAILGVGEITLAVFTVGPIPGRITATPILEGNFRVWADAGEYSLTAGMRAGMDMSLGYRRGWVDPTPTFSRSEFMTMTTERAGGAGLRAELTAGVELAVVFGGRIGWGWASVSAEARFGVPITGTLGIEADLVEEAIGCGWQGQVDWSFDVGANISIDITVWSGERNFGPYEIASGVLGTFGGRFPWCSGTMTECTGPATCLDDVISIDVCEGHMGYTLCGTGMARFCVCASSGWESCSSCQML